MRRLSAVVLLLCLAAYGVAWIAALRQSSKVASAPWPGDLGTLASLAQRFPRQGESVSAQRLEVLAAALGIPFEEGREGDRIHADVHEYLYVETARGEAGIGAPPMAVANWLASRAPAVVALRDHLLASDDLTWARDLSAGYEAPAPRVAALLRIVRLLVANALVRARNGDAGAWTDLQAAWNLNRSLQAHPDLVTQIVSLEMVRRINAASWKMPLPPPPWLDDLNRADYVRAFQRSLQYEQWLLWKHGMDVAGSEGILRRAAAALTSPFTRLEVKGAVADQLETARQIDAVTECAFDATGFFVRRSREIRVPNLSATWSRAFRHRVEREAARNALLVRGGVPIESKSRCSDGTWSFDGTSLRFSREIPKTPREPAVMPLTLRVR